MMPSLANHQSASTASIAVSIGIAHEMRASKSKLMLITSDPHQSHWLHNIGQIRARLLHIFSSGQKLSCSDESVSDSHDNSSITNRIKELMQLLDASSYRA